MAEPAPNGPVPGHDPPVAPLVIDQRAAEKGKEIKEGENKNSNDEDGGGNGDGGGPGGGGEAAAVPEGHGNRSAPLNATYTGSGLLARLFASRFPTHLVWVNLSDDTTPASVVDVVLDAKVNGAHVLKDENGLVAFGLRQALVNRFNGLAQQAVLVKYKTVLVFELALRHTFLTLSESGPGRRDLWLSLCSVLTGQSDFALQNLLAKSAVMLNDWNCKGGGHGIWHGRQREFTHLVEVAAERVAKQLPTKEELVSKLVAGDEHLTEEAKRRLRFIMKDIAAGGDRLKTDLSYDTALSIMASLKAGIYDHIDKEQGPDLRALLRVLKQRVGVLEVKFNGMPVHVSQVCSGKEIDEMLLEEAAPHFYTGFTGNHLGLVFIPSCANRFNLRVLCGGVVSSCLDANVTTAVDLARGLPPADRNFNELFADMSCADVPRGPMAAPALIVRGIDPVPLTLKDLCKSTKNFVLFRCSGQDLSIRSILDTRLTETTAGGILLRRLLYPYYVRRKCVFLASTADWVTYFEAELRAAGAEQMTVFTLVANTDGGPSCLPDPAYMLQLKDAVARAEAVNIWYKAIFKLGGKVLDAEGADDQEDADLAPRPSKKGKAPWTFQDYYRATCRNFYVTPEALQDVSEAAPPNPEDAVSASEVAAATAVFSSCASEPPPGFDVFGQVLLLQGVQPANFSARFSTFIGAAAPGWSHGVMCEMVLATSEQQVYSALTNFVGAPWILSRSVLGDPAKLMVLNVGQVSPVPDGSDFFTSVPGSSVVVRLALRCAGFDAVAHMACAEALPINIDFEALARCPECAQAQAGPGPPGAGRVKSNRFPDAPDASLSCANCCRLRRVCIEWLVVCFLANVCIARLRARRVAILPWGEDARKVVSLAFDFLVRMGVPWRRALELPDADIPHPNAVAYAVSESQVNAKLNGVVTAVKWLHMVRANVNLRDVKRLKRLIKMAYPLYDAAGVYDRRRGVWAFVRSAAKGSIEALVSAGNWMIGKVDPLNSRLDSRAGSLDVINLCHTPTCFVMQYLLQRLAVDPLFACKVERMPAREAFTASVKQDSKANVATGVSSTKLLRGERKAFARQVYDEVQLVKDSSRFRELDRLINAEHPRNKLAYEFEKMTLSLLRSLKSPVEARSIVGVGAANFFKCVIRGQEGALRFQHDKLVEILAEKAAAPQLQPKRQGDLARDSVRLKAPVTWQFVPKQPLVKLLPDVGYTSQFVSIGRRVASEVFVRAVRDVVHPENLRLLRLSRGEVRDVIETTMLLSLRRNREHFFLPSPVKGSEAGLCAASRRIFDDPVAPQTIAQDEDQSSALYLALFDWSVIHPRHQGKLSAQTDGVGLHLQALEQKEKARGFSGRSQETSVQASRSLSEVRVIGVDYGKSSAVSVALPKRVEDALHAKAELEGACLAVEKEIEEVLANLKQVAEDNAALDQEFYDRTTRFPFEACYTKDLTDRSMMVELREFDLQQRLAALQAQLPAALAAAAAAGHSEQEVRAMLSSDKNKGVQCVTKALRRVEMREKGLSDEESRRMGHFDECLRGNDTHHTLLLAVQSRHRVVRFDEKAALASQLANFRLLQIAYNSGAVRRHRRTRDICKRQFTARTLRTMTVLLPRAVDIVADEFLQNNVAFPARSPQSRARERVRGWERGAHVPQPAVPRAEGLAPLGPLYLSCDMFQSKGQRTTSTFPYKELHRSMVRLVKSSPLAKKITVQIENGYRSSRQAAGLMSYLANMERCNHRAVKLTDVDLAWQMPMVGNFKYFWCPRTRRIVRRDPPAATNMVVIGIGEVHGAPRHNIFCPET